MKIVMIASLYRPHTLGGAEVVFQMIVDELKKTHEVIVVSARQWRGFCSFAPQMSDEEGVRVYRFFPLNLCSYITFLRQPLFVRMIWHVLDAFNIHSYWVIRSILKKERPAVVLTHNLKGIGLTVPRAIASLRIPQVHTVHDIQLIYPSGILAFGEETLLCNRMMSFISSGVTRMLFSSPSAVVFASRFLLAVHAQRRFFSRSQQAVLRNPHPQTVVNVRSGHQNDPVTTNAVINRVDISTHYFQRVDISTHSPFVFVGQLEAHKGVLFLLQAWSEWRRDDVRLVVAGRGSLEPLVRAAAARDPRITFVGYCDDVATLLASALFVIVPSLCYENAPMIISESCAQRVPAVGARIGGIPEYIHEGVDGFLFSPGDRQSLIEALERACAAHGRFDDFSRHACDRARGETVAQYCAALLRAAGL